MQAASLSGWEHTEGYPVDVVREPLHLAHIRAKGPGHISAAAISPDGRLAAFAGAAAGSLRLFRLSTADVRTCLSAPARAAAPEKPLTDRASPLIHAMQVFAHQQCGLVMIEAPKTPEVRVIRNDRQETIELFCDDLCLPGFAL